MITITVTQDNKTLTITHPDDIPLTESNDSYYSWKHVFQTILLWLTFQPDTINDIMPDCEECDKCDDCEHKQGSMIVNEPEFDVEDDGKNCENCYVVEHNTLKEPCCSCFNYINWKPKELPII